MLACGKSGPSLGVVVQVRNENQRPFVMRAIAGEERTDGETSMSGAEELRPGAQRSSNDGDIGRGSTEPDGADQAWDCVLRGEELWDGTLSEDCELTESDDEKSELVEKVAGLDHVACDASEHLEELCSSSWRQRSVQEIDDFNRWLQLRLTAVHQDEVQAWI